MDFHSENSLRSFQLPRQKKQRTPAQKCRADRYTLPLNWYAQSTGFAAGFQTGGNPRCDPFRKTTEIPPNHTTRSPKRPAAEQQKHQTPRSRRAIHVLNPDTIRQSDTCQILSARARMILAITPHSNSHTLHTIRSVQFRVRGNPSFTKTRNPQKFPISSLMIGGQLRPRQGPPTLPQVDPKADFFSLHTGSMGAATHSVPQQLPRPFPQYRGNLRNRRIPCWRHYQKTPPMIWQAWPTADCRRGETPFSVPGWMAPAARWMAPAARCSGGPEK